MKSDKSKPAVVEWKRRLKPLFRVMHGLLRPPEPVRIRVHYRRFKP